MHWHMWTMFVWQPPSKSEMQVLLDRCSEFAEWVGFTFNARKKVRFPVSRKPGDSNLCRPSLYPSSWSGHHTGTDLGCPTGAYRYNAGDLNALCESLLQDTDTIFQSPLARSGKRWMPFIASFFPGSHLL